MQGLVSRIRSFFHRWVALCWAAALLPLALPAAETPSSTDRQIPPPLSLAYAPSSGKAGGVHCIFLSGDRGGLRVTLGETQLAWLADRLAEGDDPDKPVFLFLHQALKDTVAGSRPGQNWDGVDDADALRAVLTNHPNAILFTGHSHWELNSENTMFSGIANFPVCFNTASVGYTWSDRSQKTGVPVNGSEGYFLQAKEDGLLLVRGRDVDGGLWLPSAQFIVEPATRR